MRAVNIEKTGQNLYPIAENHDWYCPCGRKHGKFVNKCRRCYYDRRAHQPDYVDFTGTQIIESLKNG